MARYFLIFSIICFSSFGLLGGVNGTVDAHAEGNYNYSTASSDDNNNNNNANGYNNHGNMFEQQTGQPPNAGHEETDDSNSVHQLRLIQPSSTLKQLNIVKRAPKGFNGVRGKKQNEVTQNGIDWNSLDWPDSSEEASELGSWLDYSNTWSPTTDGRRFKKAPTAFYGVRGKKFADTGSQINNLQDLMQELQIERIRDELLQEFLDRIAMSSEYMNSIEKRTPAGFMGMRGKRSMLDLSAYDADTDDDNARALKVHQAFKRSAPSHVSFYGTRGKKQPFVDFRNKFVGVRGKKSSAPTTALARQSLTQNPEQSSELLSDAEQNYDGAPSSRYLVNMFPLFYDTIYKRTPNGFLGMRGKRTTTDDTTAKALRSSYDVSTLY